MLGIWMAYGSSDAKKTLEWGARVRLGKVSPADSLAALHTTIAMKLKHPLAVLTLTEKEAAISWLLLFVRLFQKLVLVDLCLQYFVMPPFRA